MNVNGPNHKKSLSQAQKLTAIPKQVGVEPLSQSYVSSQKKENEDNVINLDGTEINQTETNSNNVNSFFSPGGNNAERVVNISSLDIDNSIVNSEKNHNDINLKGIVEDNKGYKNDKVNLINSQNQIEDKKIRRYLIIGISIIGVGLFICLLLYFISLLK